MIQTFILLHRVAATIALHLVQRFVDGGGFVHGADVTIERGFFRRRLHRFARDHVRFQQPHGKLDMAIWAGDEREMSGCILDRRWWFGRRLRVGSRLIPVIEFRSNPLLLRVVGQHGGQGDASGQRQILRLLPDFRRIHRPRPGCARRQRQAGVWLNACASR